MAAWWDDESLWQKPEEQAQGEWWDDDTLWAVDSGRTASVANPFGFDWRQPEKPPVVDHGPQKYDDGTRGEMRPSYPTLTEYISDLASDAKLALEAGALRGIAGLAQAPGYLANAMFRANLPQPESVRRFADWANEAADRRRDRSGVDTMEAREALAAAMEEGTASGVMGALLKHPRLFLTEGSEVGGMLVPGGIFGRGVQATRVAGATGSQVLAQGSIAAGLTGGEVEAELRAMSDEELFTHLDVDRIKADTGLETDDQVREFITRGRASDAAGASFLANVLLPYMVPGGRTIERTLGGARAAGTSRGRNAVWGVAGEFTSEGAAGGIEHAASNVATFRPIGEGVPAAFTLEGALSAPIGGTAGLIQSPAQPQPELTPQEIADRQIADAYNQQWQQWQQPQPQPEIRDGEDLLSGGTVPGAMAQALQRQVAPSDTGPAPPADTGGAPGAMASAVDDLLLRNVTPEAAVGPMVPQAEPAPVDTAAAQAATAPDNPVQPTQAQKEAGNYRMGHIRLDGLDISIENPAGSERSGTDADGNPWSTTMQAHYGYIKGTRGADGDHIDAFIRPGYEGGADTPVFVVHQLDPTTGEFDEHKVMIGYASQAEAEAAYLSNYDDGWQGMGGVEAMTAAEFKEWIRDPTGPIELDHSDIRVPESGVPWADLGLNPPPPRNRVRSMQDFDPVHHDLLDWIALNGGLNREVWQAEGIDPAEWRDRAGQRRNQRFFGRPLFRKGAGMTPHDLRELMEQTDWLPPVDPFGQSTNWDDDAVQLVMRAVNQGERIKLWQGQEADQRVEQWEQDQIDLERAARMASELSYPSVEAMYDDLSYAEAAMDQRDESNEYLQLAQEYAQELAAGADGADRLGARSPGPGSQAPTTGNAVQETGPKVYDDTPAGAGEVPGFQLDGGRAGPGQAQQGQVTPQRPASQPGLFAPPTAQEVIAAERQRRQDEIDGRTGRGDTSMLAGEGELFAGPRPQQLDVEQETGRPAQDQQQREQDQQREPEQLRLMEKDQATYGKTSPLPDREGREAASEPSSADGSRPRAVPGQLDLFVHAGRQGRPAAQPDIPRLRQSARLVTTGEFRTGIEQVNNWQDAAHVVAPLRKSPQEQVVALVLDDQNRPLAVIRHSIGEVAAASVEPWSLAGAIAAVPGARSVYFAHNHPSGTTRQSGADHRVTQSLKGLLEGSGIEPMGMIVVAPNSLEASFYSNTGGDAYAPIQPAARTGSVPMQERQLRSVRPPEHGTITPGMVRQLLPEASTNEAGIVLLDTQQRPVGRVPIPLEEMGQLRSGRTDRGTARILREVARGNAPSAVIYGPDLGIARNLGEMLSQAGVQVVEVAITDGRDWSLNVAMGDGRVRTGRPFFSRQRGTRTPPKPGDQAALGTSELLAAWTMVAGQEQAYQLPVSDSADIYTIFREVAPGFRVVSNEDAQIHAESEGADRGWMIYTPAGREGVIFQRGGEVWINVSQSQRGESGSRIYNAVANYAYNNHLVFTGDPAGLSDTAMYRRLENMLSSALKFGTTEHLYPHERQLSGNTELGVPALDWRIGEDGHNLHQLLNASYQAVLAQAPEIRGMAYNPDTSRFERADGSEVTDEQFESIANSARRRAGSKALEQEARRAAGQGVRGVPGLAAGGSAAGAVEGASGVGRRTLKRAVLTHSLVSGTREGRSRLLARLGRERGARRLLSPALQKILYSWPAFHRPASRPRPRIKAADLDARVQQVLNRWRGDVPDVTVVQSARDLPDDIRRLEGHETAEGVYMLDGRVYLVADNLPSMRRAMQVLVHEAIGHHGIEAVVGPEQWAQIVADIEMMRASGKFKALFEDVDSRYDRTDPAYYREVVAIMAERGVGTSIVDRVIAAVRRFLADLGLTGTMTEDRIRQVIIDAARHVRRGEVGMFAPAAAGGTRGRSAFSFAGPRAATADTMALETAKQRIEAGENAEQVRQDTGWFRGADGKWRFEIDDSGAAWKGVSIKQGDRGLESLRRAGHDLDRPLRLSDVLDHPHLFAAYPALGDVRITIMPAARMSANQRGQLSGDVITLSDGLNMREGLSTLLHEIQHGIQRVEGFATGGSAADAFADPRMRPGASAEGLAAAHRLLNERLAAMAKPMPIEQFAREGWRGQTEITPEIREHYDEYVADVARAARNPDMARHAQSWASREWYRRLAGEVEARNVQARQMMTADDRRATPPSATQDVADSDVIVVFNGQEAHSAPPPANAGTVTAQDSDGAMFSRADEAVEYRGQHTAPTSDRGAPAHDVTGGGEFYPDDVYGPNGARYYGSGDARDNEAFAIINRLRGRPDADVTIYRAVPKGRGEINRGDWVAITRDYARVHGESVLNGDYQIITKTVKARDIFTNGDSIQEWGYDPQDAEQEADGRPIIELDDSGGITPQNPQGESNRPAHDLVDEAGATTEAEIEQARRAWQEQGTDSPWFKRWFRASQVVDDDGNPLVVYHGTDEQFDVFEMNRPAWRAIMFDEREVESQGSFFSEDESDARQFGRNLMPVYLSVQNPFIDPADVPVSSSDPESMQRSKRAWEDAEYILEPLIYEYAEGVRRIDYNNGISATEVDPDGKWISKLFVDGKIDWDVLDNPEVVARLKERGYDGARVNEPTLNSGMSWFVVSPEQIKSATDNRGTFGPAERNIYFSSGNKNTLAKNARGSERALARKHAKVEAAINQVLDTWGPNKPVVEVVRSAEDLPDWIRNREPTRYKRARGVRVGNRVWIVTNGLAEATAVEESLGLLAHEAVGHYGLDNIIDQYLNVPQGRTTGEAGWERLTADIVAWRDNPRLDARVREIMYRVQRRYARNGRPPSDQEFAREVVAHMAQAGLRNSIMDRVVAAVRRFLRQRFPGLKVNDAEVRQMIAEAAAWLQQPTEQASGQPSAAMEFANTGDPFYSALARATEEARGAPRRGNATAWKQWLDGAQRRGEFRQAERDWLGVDEWLEAQEGPVTREALADFIRANEVRVEEVTLSDADKQAASRARDLYRQRQAQEDKVNSLRSRATDDMYPRSIRDEAAALLPDAEKELMRLDVAYETANRAAKQAIEQDTPTKFSSYQLPGGQNYRELLLTLPDQSRAPDGLQFDQAVQRRLVEKYGRLDPADWTEAEAQAYREENRALDEAFDTYATQIDQENRARTYRSPHFDEPNILVHVRFNERTDADGKRVLFIEEIQSDWHQKGREDGYKSGELTEAESLRRQKDIFDRFDAGTITREQRNEELSRLSDDRQGLRGVPDAPFKATDEWAMLAFKRMARWAAENGFDRIAWTTGTQQAERYDLSKLVSQIRVVPGARNTAIPVGTRYVQIDMAGQAPLTVRVNADGVIAAGRNDSQFSGQSLDELIGREMAEKVMAAEKETAFKGDGLRVGGDGMKGFYDNILPKAVNKWAKKFGAKARPVKIDDWTAHGIDITPKMRDSVLDGQPLFNLAESQADVAGATTEAEVEQARRAWKELGTDSPWFKRWFGDSKVVDAEGKPLVVYHGTPDARFMDADATFMSLKDRFGARQGVGAFWFAADRATASSYADARRAFDYQGAEPQVIPAFLKLENPLIIDGRGREWREAQAIGKTTDVIEKAQAEGHDGVIIRNVRDNYINSPRTRPTDTYVVFNSRQIKSATDNRGTFDPESPSILLSRPRQYTSEQKEFMRKAGLPVESRTRLERLADWVTDQVEALRQFVADGDTRRQALVDRFHGIRAAYEATGQTDIQRMDGYVSARLSTGLAAVMEGVMMHGAPQWQDGVLGLKPGTKGLMAALEPVKGDLDAWLGWMVARRAKLLMGQGREHNMTEADIDAGLDLAKGKEAQFMQAAYDYLQIKNAILDVAEEAGLIDPDARATWDHAEYIPFYRAGEESVGPGTRRSLANQSSGIRTLRGGKSVLADPLANIMRNFTRLIDASMKNNAMLEVHRDLGADFFQKVPSVQFTGAIVPRAQIRKQLLESGVPQSVVGAIPANALEGMAKMWAVKPPTADDVVRIMRNGKAEYYRVDDPLLLRSMSAFAVKPRGAGMKVMIWAKRILTAGATATAEFAAANTIRDSLEGWMVADENFKPLVDSIRGALNTLRADERTQELMMAGSYFAHGHIWGGDVDATAAALRRSLRAHGIANKDMESYIGTIARSPAKLWDTWTKVQSSLEHGTRRAMYDAALREGKTRKQAAFTAKDLLDFSMRGDSEFIAFFTDVVPFLNARLQGLYKVGRTYQRNRNQLAMRGGMIATATLALLAWNLLAHGDAYDELPEWEKDTYWHIGPGTAYHTRIPKPFELGIIFGTAIERGARAILNLAGSESGESFGKTFESMTRALAETLALDPTPQAVKPIVEQLANRDFFRDVPIEGLADENKLPEARYGPRTSDTAKLVPAAVANATGMSPKRIEHLWRGYTAGLGDYAMRMSDFLVRRAQGEPYRPAMEVRDWPLIGRFVRGDAPARSTRFQTEFYDAKRKAEQVAGTIKEYLERAKSENRPELLDRAMKLQEDNLHLLGPARYRSGAKGSVTFGMVTFMNQVQRQVSAIREKEQAIINDPTLSRTEKRDLINDLIQQRNDMLREAMEVIGG